MPAAQAVQADWAVAPVAAEKVPPAQLAHMKEPASAKVPAPQSPHVDDVDAPVLGEYRPFGIQCSRARVRQNEPFRKALESPHRSAERTGSGGGVDLVGAPVAGHARCGAIQRRVGAHGTARASGDGLSSRALDNEKVFQFPKDERQRVRSLFIDYHDSISGSF